MVSFYLLLGLSLYTAHHHLAFYVLRSAKYPCWFINIVIKKLISSNCITICQLILIFLLSSFLAISFSINSSSSTFIVSVHVATFWRFLLASFNLFLLLFLLQSFSAVLLPKFSLHWSTIASYGCKNSLASSNTDWSFGINSV